MTGIIISQSGIIILLFLFVEEVEEFED